jgi:NAD(P)-dependent dehydrogenase (short-subunit alcohol dehydrogenase family)
MLEEAYLYIDMPEPSFGVQFVYTDPQKPELVQVVREGDCVLMPKGYHPNVAAPGYMRTDNTAALQQDETRNRQILERIPAGRWGEPSDLAGAAVFLSSTASDYLHGHVLVVDGGWMAR